MRLNINCVEFSRSDLGDVSSFMDRAVGLPGSFFAAEATLLDLCRYASRRFLVEFIEQHWSRWRALELGVARDCPDLVQAAIQAFHPTRAEIHMVVNGAGPKVRAKINILARLRSLSGKSRRHFERSEA